MARHSFSLGSRRGRFPRRRWHGRRGARSNDRSASGERSREVTRATAPAWPGPQKPCLFRRRADRGGFLRSCWRSWQYCSHPRPLRSERSSSCSQAGILRASRASFHCSRFWGPWHCSSMVWWTGGCVPIYPQIITAPVPLPVSRSWRCSTSFESSSVKAVSASRTASSNRLCARRHSSRYRSGCSRLR